MGLPQCLDSDQDIVVDEESEGQARWQLEEFERRRRRKAPWVWVRRWTWVFLAGFLVSANLPRITNVGDWLSTLDLVAGGSAVLALVGCAAMLIFYAVAGKTLSCPGCKKANTALSGAPCGHCGLGGSDDLED